MFRAPTPDLAGLALYSEVAPSVPGELKVNSEASPAPTSWMPVVVNTLVWFDESVTARTSTSFANWLSALSR